MNYSLKKENLTDALQNKKTHQRNMIRPYILLLNSRLILAPCLLDVNKYSQNSHSH